MIYFIQAGENGPIKIGKTDNDVQQRLAQLQTGNHEQLNLIWLQEEDSTITTETGGYMVTEEQIHIDLREYRIQGEWFKPVPVLDYIHKNLIAINSMETLNTNSLIEVGETYDTEEGDVKVSVRADIEINGTDNSWEVEQDCMSLNIDLSESQNLYGISIRLPHNIERENVKIHRSVIK